MHDPKFMLGMVFSNKAEFKLACKHHGVKEGRRIRLKKVDKRRVTVICMDCDWMISTAHLDGDESLHITSLRAKHTCGTTFNHGCASASFLSKKYVEDIRVMPQMKISEFVQKVYADLKLNISRTKASLAKRMATIEIEGDYTMQYARLPDYCHELKRANPGSNVILKTLENDYGDEIFQRLYICLQGCKQGFLAACRPLVGLDGCFLKGPHKGILLIAVGLDPNDQIFPIAYAVVETENKATWKWFLYQLEDDLAITDSSCWTFITDKQKVIKSFLFLILLLDLYLIFLCMTFRIFLHFVIVGFVKSNTRTVS